MGVVGWAVYAQAPGGGVSEFGTKAADSPEGGHRNRMIPMFCLRLPTALEPFVPISDILDRRTTDSAPATTHPA
ncbi:hypothetical protein SAMN05216355_102166 [Actinomyces ruminicola]|uniref:Uncharacterized protein n=1 Tax=Actinomyces ruminicola TaxID=332524 RepID=A0A1H0AVX9_9ACTO|nr:hypothetical protein SAMN05216355_102166 [Actinomyces ruminicola]